MKILWKKHFFNQKETLKKHFGKKVTFWENEF